MIKNEEKLRTELAQQESPSRKHQRTGKDRDVEEGLISWFKEMRSRGAPIHGPLLCTKAEELARALGRDDFKATEGWFYRWKQRNGLRRFAKSGFRQFR